MRELAGGVAGYLIGEYLLSIGVPASVILISFAVVIAVLTLILVWLHRR